jgi:hypothetical protein
MGHPEVLFRVEVCPHLVTAANVGHRGSYVSIGILRFAQNDKGLRAGCWNCDVRLSYRQPACEMQALQAARKI